MGEASASELNPEPIKDLKGEAWVGLLAAGFFPFLIHFFFLRAERPEGEARKLLHHNFYD